MSIHVPIVGDPPMGHDKRRAKIRQALADCDFVTLAEMYRKHGDWHMYEAMELDASATEVQLGLPRLLHQLLMALVTAQNESNMWAERCRALSELKKPDGKPDDIPF